MPDFIHFPPISAIFDDFSEFCRTFGILHFQKSSNSAKSLEKMKKNLSIILLLKWPFLEPKMFIAYIAKILTGCFEDSLLRKNFFYDKNAASKREEMPTPIVENDWA